MIRQDNKITNVFPSKRPTFKSEDEEVESLLARALALVGGDTAALIEAAKKTSMMVNQKSPEVPRRSTRRTRAVQVRPPSGKKVSPKRPKEFVEAVPAQFAPRVVLSNDGIFFVSQFLDAPSLVCASFTCRQWAFVAKDERLWMWLYLHRWPQNKPAACMSWRREFALRYQREGNWAIGHCKVTRLVGHTESLTSLASSGNVCVTGSDDYTLRVWNYATGECRCVLEGHTGKVFAVVLHRGQVISCSDDKLVHVWDPNTGGLLHVLRGHRGAVTCLATHGDTIASGSIDSNLRLWSLSGGTCRALLTGHRGAVLCVAVTADGSFVSGSRDGDVRVWDQFGISRFVLAAHTEAVTSLMCSGHHVVSAGDDKVVRVWDTEDGRLQLELPGHGGPVMCAYFSGTQVITGCFDGIVRVFSITTGRCERTLRGHRNAVTSLDVREDGLCVTGSNDRDVRVWQLATGESSVLRGHTSGVGIVRVVGDVVLSAGDDYDLRAWDFTRT